MRFALAALLSILTGSSALAAASTSTADYFNEISVCSSFRILSMGLQSQLFSWSNYGKWVTAITFTIFFFVMLWNSRYRAPDVEYFGKKISETAFAMIFIMCIYHVGNYKIPKEWVPYRSVTLDYCKISDFDERNGLAEDLLLATYGISLTIADKIRLDNEALFSATPMKSVMTALSQLSFGLEICRYELSSSLVCKSYDSVYPWCSDASTTKYNSSDAMACLKYFAGGTGMSYVDWYNAQQMVGNDFRRYIENSPWYASLYYKPETRSFLELAQFASSFTPIAPGAIMGKFAGKLTPMLGARATAFATKTANVVKEKVSSIVTRGPFGGVRTTAITTLSPQLGKQVLNSTPAEDPTMALAMALVSFDFKKFIDLLVTRSSDRPVIFAMTNSESSDLISVESILMLLLYAANFLVTIFSMVASLGYAWSIIVVIVAAHALAPFVFFESSRARLYAMWKPIVTLGIFPFIYIILLLIVNTASTITMDIAKSIILTSFSFSTVMKFKVIMIFMALLFNVSLFAMITLIPKIAKAVVDLDIETLMGFGAEMAGKTISYAGQFSQMAAMGMIVGGGLAKRAGAQLSAIGGNLNPTGNFTQEGVSKMSAFDKIKATTGMGMSGVGRGLTKVGSAVQELHPDSNPTVALAHRAYSKLKGAADTVIDVGTGKKSASDLHHKIIQPAVSTVIKTAENHLGTTESSKFDWLKKDMSVGRVKNTLQQPGNIKAVLEKAGIKLAANESAELVEGTSESGEKTLTIKIKKA